MVGSCGTLCAPHQPGTREGVILVSQAPSTSAATVAPDEGALTVTDDERRRAQLADFLRARRDALQPTDVGLPGGGRRRTPGLRREEVAQLAGVGATWYTWLEQGRDVRASLDVLEALSSALRLTPAERAHLVMLGRGEEPPPPPVEPEHVSATLRRLIADLEPNPAYLLGRRWDFLAWNRAVTVLFGDLGALPPAKRNHVWLTFMDPKRRELLCDWEEGARSTVARFRTDYARHVGDPAFESLVAALLDQSPDFRRWWPRHEVLATGEGRKEIEHPVVGRLVFEHAAFRRAEATDQRLLLYTPVGEADTSAKLDRLLRAAPGNTQ